MKDQKEKSQQGFAVVEALLILVVIGLLGGVGYWVLTQRSTTNMSASNSSVPTAAPKDLKSTQSFEEVVNQDLQTVDTSNDNAASAYAGASQSDASAVSSVGDAYNETNY